MMKPNLLTLQRQFLEAQLGQLDDQLTIERHSADTQGAFLDRVRPLLKEGYISQLQIQQLETQQAQVASQVKSLMRQRYDTRQQLNSTFEQLRQLPRNTATKLNELHRPIAQAQQTLLTNGNQRATVLRSARDGLVFALLVRPGQVVTGRPGFIGEPLQAQLLVPSSAKPPACSLEHVEVCESNQLYWSPGFKEAVTKFMDRQGTEEAAYLYRGAPLAEQQLEMLRDGKGKPLRIAGLYFFIANARWRDRGAIFLDPAGRIPATAMLWSPCVVPHSEIGDCTRRPRLTVFVADPEKRKSLIVSSLSRWAKSEVEHFEHSPGYPPGAFDSVIIVDPASDVVRYD